MLCAAISSTSLALVLFFNNLCGMVFYTLV